MPAISIRAADRPLPDGDLDARMVGGALEVPHRLASALLRQDIRTAEQLISYGQAFPTALAAALGWAPETAHAAVARLARELGLPEGTESRPAVHFGARDPTDLERR